MRGTAALLWLSACGVDSMDPSAEGDPDTGTGGQSCQEVEPRPETVPPGCEGISLPADAFVWAGCLSGQRIGASAAPNFACRTDLMLACPCRLVSLITIDFGDAPIEVGTYPAGSLVMGEGWAEQQEDCPAHWWETELDVEIVAATDTCVAGWIDRQDVPPVGFYAPR